MTLRMNTQKVDVYPKPETEDDIAHEQREDKSLSKARDRRWH
jgi:hypothetical protein